jgi:hypothetical protein
MIKLILSGAAIVTGSMASAAGTSQTSTASPAQSTAAPGHSATADPALVCKFVVHAGPARENKPYQLCQSEQYWAAKQAADEKNANRVECHYQEITGSRLRAGKRCMTADMWAQERQMTADYIQKIQAATAGPH